MQCQGRGIDEILQVTLEKKNRQAEKKNKKTNKKGLTRIFAEV